MSIDKRAERAAEVVLAIQLCSNTCGASAHTDLLHLKEHLRSNVTEKDILAANIYLDALAGDIDYIVRDAIADQIKKYVDLNKIYRGHSSDAPTV